MIDKNSASLRNAQRTLADNTRQIDLPRFEIVRIRAGDFTESEVARIENAKSVLSENGFDNELKLLESSKAQQELLLAHYSGNIPVFESQVTQPLAKFRQLRRIGFSSGGLRVLGDEGVLGIREEIDRIGLKIDLSIKEGRNRIVVEKSSLYPLIIAEFNVDRAKRFEKVHGLDQSIYPEIELTPYDLNPRTKFDNTRELMAQWTHRVLNSESPIQTPPMRIFDNEGEKWLIRWNVKKISKDIYEIDFYHPYITRASR